MRVIAPFLLMVLLLMPRPHLDAATPPHGVYIGAACSGDARNPVSGGWDNESAYSVDREMVQWQGRNFAFEEIFSNLDNFTNEQDALNAPYQEYELIWYYGRVPIVNLSYDDVRPPQCRKTLVQLATSLDDPSSPESYHLRLWARGVKRWLNLGTNRFLVLAFQQEANYNTCATEGAPSTWDYASPEGFKTVYRKAKGIVNAELGADASRLQWAFAPNCWSNTFQPPFESYYPGDDAVDWLGISAYNFGGFVVGDTSAPSEDFDTLVRPYLDRLRRLSPRKPLALLQTASVSLAGYGLKDQWVKDLLQSAVTYPRLYLVSYFNVINPGEGGIPAGMDFPVFWNDPYRTGPPYNIYYENMRYAGWLTAVQSLPLVFSPVSMPAAGAFARAGWDIQGIIGPAGSRYALFPELRDRTGDYDGDGVPNWKELEAGLDPRVRDAVPVETECSDGIDNDANGRTDSDDTVACGDLPLTEAVPKDDETLYNGEYRYFSFVVPTGSAVVRVSVTGLSGDVNLYIKRSARPDTRSFDFKSSNVGLSTEEVKITAPEPGVWHLLVHGGIARYQVMARNSVTVAPKLQDVISGIACDLDGNGQDEMIFSVVNYGVQAYFDNKSWADLLVGGTHATALGCGDMDGDGTQDLVAIVGGSLRQFSLTEWAWEVIPAPGSIEKPDLLVVNDFDGDGRSEVIAAFAGVTGLQMRRGSTGRWEVVPVGSYAVPDGLYPAQGSGNAAKLIGLWKSGSAVRLYDFRSGAWVAVPLPSGFTTQPDIVHPSDVDGDGVTDIVGIWRHGPYAVKIRYGNTGTWGDFRSGTYRDAIPIQIVPADVDSDKRDDLVAIWDAWRQIQIFLWDFWDISTWRFVYDGPSPLLSMKGNFDGDLNGRQDIAFVWPDDIKIWLNNQGLADVRRFQDVPLNYWSTAYIDALVNAGVTSGCQGDDPTTFRNEALYCPEMNVTRSQMAVFIIKALGQQPAPACTGRVFNDVNASTVGDAFCRYIEKFGALGITSGCGSGNYCPGSFVTRSQMAVFIIKALGQQPAPACTGRVFNDVNAPGLGVDFCRYIEKFVTLGITAGCGNGNYCPGSLVTRSQMAVFLTKAFLQ